MNVSSLVGAIALSLAMTPLSLAQSVAPATTTRVEILQDGRQLRVIDAGQTLSIDANAIDVDVLNALDCDRVELVDRQTLTGQRFVFNSAVVQSDSGIIAVGLLLQDCIETQVSTVLLLQPDDGSYSIQPIQVPGRRPLPDDEATYPLQSITAVGFLGGDLLVKHADASGSEAMLVFAATPSGEPQFAGCVYTRVEEGDRLCPPRSVAN